MNTKLMTTAMASIAAFSATAVNAQDITAHTVYYNHNSAESTEIQNQLDQIVNSCNIQSVQVVCHTDTTGSAVYNQNLSERRAVDVMNDLVSRGVQSNLITTSGQGETNNVIDRGDNVREEANRRCEIVTTCAAAYVEPVQQTYTQPTQTYTQPAQTYTETVVEQAPYQAPTPIEPTTTQVAAPYQTPTPVTSTVPSAPISSAPVSAPYVPASAPPPLPPVSTGGGFLGGISTPVLIGGLAAVVAAGVLIADNDDDEPASP